MPKSLSIASFGTYFFFFNDTATTEIYTFPTRRSSDLPPRRASQTFITGNRRARTGVSATPGRRGDPRSEEHTSELQSQSNLVCRLLLEKKKKKNGEQYCRTNEGMRAVH